MKEETISRIRKLRELIWPADYDEDTHRELDRDFFAELRKEGFLVRLKGFGKDGIAEDIFAEIERYGATAAQMAFKEDEGFIEFWEFENGHCRRLLTGKAQIFNRKLLLESGYKGIPVLALDPVMGFGVGVWNSLENEARWVKAWSGAVSEERSSVRTNRTMIKATDEEWAFIVRHAKLSGKTLNDYMIDNALQK